MKQLKMQDPRKDMYTYIYMSEPLAPCQSPPPGGMVPGLSGRRGSKIVQIPRDFPDVSPTILDISGTFSGFVSKHIPGHFQDNSRNVLEIARRPGHVTHISRTILDISRKLSEHSWRCPGDFLEITGKFPRQFQDISRTFPDHSRRSP